jgi:hypothetical protein
MPFHYSSTQLIDPAAIILNEGWTPPRLQI